MFAITCLFLLCIYFASCSNHIGNVSSAYNGNQLPQFHMRNFTLSHLRINKLTDTIAVPTSKYAYATLIHGIDESFKYRGFLYNTIIFKKLMEQYGSKADFIAMIGFTKGNSSYMFDNDINLLKSLNIKIYYLPRILQSKKKINFAEMALLKITPWSFINYKAIQFIDADIMPRKSLDSYFSLSKNTYHTGLASPINSGWFLAIPSMQDYNNMWEMAVSRLSNKWDVKIGWGNKIPSSVTFRTGVAVGDWNFNGASLDQGLFTDYFMLRNGNIQVLDKYDCKVYSAGYKWESITFHKALKCCEGMPPIAYIVHFTGRSKPWLKPVQKQGSDAKLWFRTLDSLKLPINSSTISMLQLMSPLGYFHANT